MQGVRNVRPMQVGKRSVMAVTVQRSQRNKGVKSFKGEAEADGTLWRKLKNKAILSPTKT